MTHHNHHTLYVTLILLIASSVKALNTDEFIYNPRISGAILNSSITEPALLPLMEYPLNGVTIPFPLSGTFELSNNQFTLYNPITLFIYRKNPGRLLSQLLYSSFDIEGLSPSNVSRELSDQLEDGTDITFDADYTFTHFAHRNLPEQSLRGFSFQLKSCSNASLHIPGDAFKLIFSNTEGLQQGNSLSLGSFDSEMRVTTNLSGSYGSVFPRRTLLFKQLSWGISGTYMMGHMMFRMETENAEIVYRDDNTLSINANANITSSGIALTDSNQFILNLQDGNIVNGHGFGISGGIAVSGEQLLLSISVNNLGLMAWHSSVMSQEIHFFDDSLYVMDMMDGSQIEVTPNSAVENVVYAEKSFSTVKISYFSNSTSGSPISDKLSSARAASLGYIQPFYENNQNNRPPLFFAVFENEFLNRRLPVRLGWDYQTMQNYSSFFEIEQVLNSLTLSFRYKAHCDPIFRSTKGSEIGIRSHIYW